MTSNFVILFPLCSTNICIIIILFSGFVKKQLMVYDLDTVCFKNISVDVGPGVFLMFAHLLPLMAGLMGSLMGLNGRYLIFLVNMRPF